MDRDPGRSAGSSCGEGRSGASHDGGTVAAATPPGAVDDGWGELTLGGDWGDLVAGPSHEASLPANPPNEAKPPVVAGAPSDGVGGGLLEAVVPRPTTAARGSVSMACKPLLAACRAVRVRAPEPGEAELDGPDDESDGPEGPLVIVAVEPPAAVGDGEQHALGAQEPEALAEELALVERVPGAPSATECIRRACGFDALDSVLVEGVRLGAAGEACIPMDAMAQTILSDLTSSSATAVVSDSAAAQRLGVDRKKLRVCRNRFACAAVLCERLMAKHMMHAVIAEVRRQGGRTITLCEFPRYDETPMISRVKDLDIVYDLTHGRRALVEGAALPKVTYEALPQKILQTEWKYAMLFEVSGKYIVIEMNLLSLVQTMAKGNAETYESALRISGLDLQPFCSLFPLVQRVASTDGDSAVARAERHIAQSRPHIAPLHLRCVVHRAASMKESVMRIKAGLAQEITHVVLSLRASRGIVVFRRIVKNLVLSKLRIDRTSLPTAEHQSHHRRILGAFLPSTTGEVSVQKATIAALANGDWSDTTTITHHCLGSPLADHEIRAAFSTAFISALVGSGPNSFPSRNWVGAEHAPTWLGLLAACHGLLQAAYCQWAREMAGHGRLAENGVGASDVGVVDGGAPAIADEEPAAAAMPREATYTAVQPAIGGHPSVDQLREEHAKFRATGVRWLSSRRHVAVEMLCVRMALEPHRRFMARHLQMAGAEWDEMQMAEGATQMLRGEAEEPEATTAPRLLRAFEGALELATLREVHHLMSSGDIWALLPCYARTPAIQNDLFRMLSRSACRAHRIRYLHQGYPYRMFGLIGNSKTEVLSQIWKDEKCVRDAWSQRIVEHFGADLGGLDAAAVLKSIAAVAHEETVQIETRHATLRRVLLARSIQSKRLDIDALNSDKAWCPWS